MLFTPFGKIKIKDKKGTGILNEDGTILSSQTDHGYDLLVNYSGIIFCKKANISEMPDAYLLEDQVCFASTNGIIRNLLDSFMKTLDPIDIYNLF